MIVLDTNVVSEPLKLQPNPKIVAWLDAQDIRTLYLAAPSFSELLVGVELLPAGRRKNALREGLLSLIEGRIQDRILPFDAESAKLHAKLWCQARSQGYEVSLADSQIAAIASLHSFTVATRDVDPFTSMGVPIVNPWQL